MSAPRNVRVYDTLRTAHLERAHRQADATIVHRARSYDFDESAVAGLDVRRLGTGSLIAMLLREPVSTLEVNEPLMRTGVSRAAAAVTAVRLRDALARRHTRVVTYAIDNRDPYRLDPTPTLRSRVRRAAQRRAARLVWRAVDRVAFGTPAARETYAHALPALRPATRSVDIPHLPVPCACLPADDRSRGCEVVFVGALTERKGLPELLAAWPAVRAAAPDAHLSVLGTGALADTALGAAAGDPSIEVVLDPARDTIHAAFRRARVAVLLSQPRPRWREQVGLPVVEALEHGVRVVASTEGGLAPWLAAHGHRVLDPAAGPAAVASAIVDSLAAHDSAAVLADLPATEGRADADTWLFGAD